MEQATNDVRYCFTRELVVSLESLFSSFVWTTPECTINLIRRYLSKNSLRSEYSSLRSLSQWLSVFFRFEVTDSNSSNFLCLAGWVGMCRVEMKSGCVSVDRFAISTRRETRRILKISKAVAILQIQSWGKIEHECFSMLFSVLFCL